jgi:hypothetical protein
MGNADSKITLQLPPRQTATMSKSRKTLVGQTLLSAALGFVGDVDCGVLDAFLHFENQDQEAERFSCILGGRNDGDRDTIPGNPPQLTAISCV